LKDRIKNLADVSLGGVEELNLTFELKIKGSTIVLQCCQVFIDNFEFMVKKKLGLSVPAPSSLPAMTVPTPADPQEEKRKAALFNPKVDSESLLTQNDLGNSTFRTYMAIAHFITHHTQLFVFGGFIRDMLIRGHLHNELDLDVGFDTEFGKTSQSSPLSSNAADQEIQRIFQWASRQNIFVSGRQDNTNVVGYSLQGPNQERISLELVNVAYFRAKHGLPDANVNCLRILPTQFSAQLAHKFPDESQRRSGQTMAQLCGSIDEILGDIRAKKLRITNPTTFDERRRAKFQGRGWTIVSF